MRPIFTAHKKCARCKQVITVLGRVIKHKLYCSACAYKIKPELREHDRKLHRRAMKALGVKYVTVP